MAKKVPFFVSILRITLFSSAFVALTFAQTVTDDFSGSSLDVKKWFPMEKVMENCNPIINNGQLFFSKPGAGGIKLRNWTLKDYYMEVDVYPGTGSYGIIDIYVRCDTSSYRDGWPDFVYLQFYEGEINLKCASQEPGSEQLDSKKFPIATDFSRKYRVRIEALA